MIWTRTIVIAVLAIFSSAASVQAASHPKRAVSSAATPSLRFPILSMKDYLALPKDKRSKYIRELRKALKDFEHSAGKPSEVSFFRFINEAWAEDGSWKNFGECLVGGVFRTPSDTGFCPTGGRPCNGNADESKFKCGVIYGEVCVDRAPVEGLTERCEQKAPADLAADKYGPVQSLLKSKLEEMCKDSDKDRRKDSCDRLSQRMTKLAGGKSDPTITKEQKEKCDQAVKEASAASEKGILSTINGFVTTDQSQKCQAEFETGYQAIRSACVDFQPALVVYWKPRRAIIQKINQHGTMTLLNNCGLLSLKTCHQAVKEAGEQIMAYLKAHPGKTEEALDSVDEHLALQNHLPLRFNQTTTKFDRSDGGDRWYYCPVDKFAELFKTFDDSTNHELLTTTEVTSAKPPGKKTGTH